MCTQVDKTETEPGIQTQRGGGRGDIERWWNEGNRKGKDQVYDKSCTNYFLFTLWNRHL